MTTWFVGSPPYTNFWRLKTYIFGRGLSPIDGNLEDVESPPLSSPISSSTSIDHLHSSPSRFHFARNPCAHRQLPYSDSLFNLYQNAIQNIKSTTR